MICFFIGLYTKKEKAKTSSKQMLFIAYYFWSVCGFNVITIAPTIANNNIIDVMINHIE